MKIKIRNSTLSILLALSFVCAFSISTVVASDRSINQLHTEVKTNEALKLINELVSLSLQQELYENQIAFERERGLLFFAERQLGESRALEAIEVIESRIVEIERLLDAAGVLTLDTNEDMESFFDVSAGNYLRVDAQSNQVPWPNPGSNANIQFYGIFDRASNGQQIWLLIASPRNNMPHSANQNVTRTGQSGSFLRDGARTLMEVYAERAFGNIWDSIPVIRWLPWEIVPNLLPETTQGQLPEFEATMTTRTVTQFVYFSDSFAQPVFYGSTNIVHIGLSQRYLDTRGAVPVWRASSPIIVSESAINYFDFGRLIVNQNLTGFNVRVQHSFVNTVTQRATGNIVLTIRPPGFTLPIQATW